MLHLLKKCKANAKAFCQKFTSQGICSLSRSNTIGLLPSLCEFLTTTATKEGDFQPSQFPQFGAPLRVKLLSSINPHYQPLVVHTNMKASSNDLQLLLPCTILSYSSEGKLRLVCSQRRTQSMVHQLARHQALLNSVISSLQTTVLLASWWLRHPAAEPKNVC